MALKETRTCDICGTHAEKILTMTIYDNELKQAVHVSDLCEAHFNLIRSYVRHNCPQVSRLPLPGEAPIFIPNTRDKDGLVDVQDCQR